MKKILFSLIAIITCHNAYAQRPSDFVNPLIGTSNYGVTQPGPAVPQGITSMSPFNTIPAEGNKINTSAWCSTPYVFENKWCIGFTQVNLSGVGCPDLGSLILLPTSGKLEVDCDKYATTISDINSKVGYMSAKIDKYGTFAEMTATEHSTRSRYTFPEGKGHILLNIGKALSTESGGSARIVNETEVEGMRLLGDFCYGRPQGVYPLYFVARVNRPSDIYYWKKQQKSNQWSSTNGTYKLYTTYNRPIAGDDIGIVFNYDTGKNDVVEISIGVSYVSIENARQNLEAEQGGKSFEQLVEEAKIKWDKVLDVADIEGGTADEKIQFYTALYHNYFHPNILNDVNGEYPAMMSGKTLRTDSTRLTMFSGWDVYRIQPQFGALFFPKRINHMAQALMDMYREGGHLPLFETLSQEFMVMEGDPALPYLTACYKLGLTRGIDPEEMYQAMMKNAEGLTEVRMKDGFYKEHGYVPYTHKYDNSVSQALELYIADWALAEMAGALGKDADRTAILKRTNGYSVYFDPAYGLMRPVKSDGKFLDKFEPTQGLNFTDVDGFHEGCSWNYSFAIPYDIPGLIKLHGSPKVFASRLNECFEKGYFDMGNEPDMGYPFLFNYVKGKEYLTQYWVNDCLKKYFGNRPSGLPGNDDTGTMSAWQNFAMIGLYPVCPAKTVYAISTPVFDKVTLKLDPEYYGGNTLTIKAVNRSDKNIYIDHIELDGKPYKSYFIDHKTLTGSHELTVYCTDKHK